MTSVHAEAVFPMQVENKVIGVLTLGSPQDRRGFMEEQLDLLNILVAMGAISVGNAILYDSLVKQNLKLSEIADLKTEFVSTVSHELSTPLNGILGLTEVLLDGEASGPLTDDQRRYLQMIRSAGEELSNIVNEILDLARFQSRRGTLEVKRVDLAKAVDSVRADFEAVFQEKGIRFQMDLGPQSHVYGDEGQIKQVVQSLMENAVKFTRDQPDNVLGIQAAKRGDMLRVCMYDQGIGVDEKDQEVIFDEFRQADGTVNRCYGGTGLGLALARKIVELHGGRIWVESKKGKGSHFYFTLPLKPGLVQAPEIDTQRS
jgi:signal transduction histidine kinase